MLAAVPSHPAVAAMSVPWAQRAMRSRPVGSAIRTLSSIGRMSSCVSHLGSSLRRPVHDRSTIVSTSPLLAWSMRWPLPPASRGMCVS
jgi:hypothetical protein